MSTTHLTQHVRGDPATVFRAIITAEDVACWMVPDGMQSHVHHFEGWEGGTFRISLTYDAPTGAGKTSAHTDTYHGRFVELVPDEKVVQVIEFESGDPEMQGEMTVTLTLVGSGAGTEVHAEHANVPSGVRPEDNELGWRMSLAKLAALIEGSKPALD